MRWREGDLVCNGKRREEGGKKKERGEKKISRREEFKGTPTEIASGCVRVSEIEREGKEASDII
jgi:hypothetical protein